MSGQRHLFIPGPTNVPQQVRLAMDIAQEDQRSPDFPGFVLPLLQDLKRVFKTTAGTAFIFPGTGTLGWEAALANTLSPGDRVLAARFGQFSHLWIEMCRRHGLEGATPVPVDVAQHRADPSGADGDGRAHRLPDRAPA